MPLVGDGRDGGYGKDRPAANIGGNARRLLGNRRSRPRFWNGARWVRPDDQRRNPTGFSVRGRCAGGKIVNLVGNQTRCDQICLEAGTIIAEG